MAWDEFEKRFENNELKWIADFVVNNLVFVKTTLKLSNAKTEAEVLQLLWETLDLFGPDQDVESAIQSRYKILREGLTRLNLEGSISKDDAKDLLEYTRRTIFGHLQLFLACIRMGKQEKRVKRVKVMIETPQFLTDLDSCKEIVAMVNAL